MDPEQTFIRVQERLSRMLTPRIRSALEHVFLVMALALFSLLIVMHANYVQQVVTQNSYFYFTLFLSLFFATLNMSSVKGVLVVIYDEFRLVC